MLFRLREGDRETKKEKKRKTENQGEKRVGKKIYQQPEVLPFFIFSDLYIISE